MLRGLAAIGLIIVGSLVACTTFNNLTATDGILNPNGKVANAECTVDQDCQSLSCKNNKCTAPITSSGSSGSKPTDGKKDGDETDVDCGGTAAPKCQDTKSCGADTDCSSSNCLSGVCAEPSPTDGRKNEDETDVDCGGKTAPKCATDKICATNDDCAVGGCSYQLKCVQFASCTAHEGGDTCGSGEDGDANAKHESCCTTVTNGNGDPIAKYYATAGRMRAFVTRYNGDLQSWAATNPKGWNTDWTDQLPTSMQEAMEALGPDGKRGCNVTSDGQGARTYAGSVPSDADPTDKSDFDQKVLDEKMQNCVTWHMAQALCTFDGGRLANGQELEDLITNGNTTTWPWEFQDKTSYNPNGQDPRVTHRYSYATPNPPANLRGGTSSPVDHAFYIAPPGRTPLGADKYGAMDAVGAILPWADDDVNFFLFTESWEEHPKQFPVQSFTQGSSDGANGYYALGIRCVFPKQ